MGSVTASVNQWVFTAREYQTCVFNLSQCPPLLCYTSGKRIHHFICGNWLIKSLHCVLAKPKQMADFSTQKCLPSPNRWHISQRNARVLIWNPRSRVVGLDSQDRDPQNRVVGLDISIIRCSVLCALCNQSETPTERFLPAVQSSCFAQQTADLNHHVLWSRRLLSCHLAVFV